MQPQPTTSAPPPPPDDLAKRFEARYQLDAEPWEFSGRGAEILRHRSVARRVRALAPRHVLDVGCSAGQLTVALAGLPARLFAMDVSPTAVRRARARVADGTAGKPLAGLAGSAISLPLKPGTLDVVVASDGLVSWDLSTSQRAASLREFHAVLRTGGHLLLTEYLRPQRFAGFVDEIAASPFEIVAVDYMYDRPWYKLEPWLRKSRPIRRSPVIAHALRMVGRLFGPNGSRHLIVLARKV